MKIAPSKQASLSARQQKILSDQNSASFGKSYFQLCQLYSLPVLTHLINHEPNTLSLDVDKIHKDEEWSPVLVALKKNRDLSRISIFSEANGRKDMIKDAGNRFDNGRGSVKTVFRILPELMSGVRDGLLFNAHLKSLEISGIPLRETALKLLAKGIINNTKLQYLSFNQCRIGDSGIFILAPSIRTVKHLRILNLSGCCLTEKGAHIISAFLKSLAVRRQADLWAYSLRMPPSGYDPSISILTSKDAPKPLKRLILCHNELGDLGLIPLYDLLYEEVGLGALDLHHNQLTNKSGIKAIEVLKVNRDLVVLDLKGNDIDAKILNEINHYLIINDKARQLLHPGIDNDFAILDEKPMLFGGQCHTKQTQSSISKMAKMNIRSSDKIIHIKNSQLLNHGMLRVTHAMTDSKQKTNSSNQLAKKELLERIKLMRKIPNKKPKLHQEEIPIVIFPSKLKKNGSSTARRQEFLVDSVLDGFQEIDKTLDALDLYYNEGNKPSKFKTELPLTVKGLIKEKGNTDLQNENFKLKKRVDELELLVSSFLNSIAIPMDNSGRLLPTEKKVGEEKQEIPIPITEKKFEKSGGHNNLEQEILKIQGARKEPRTSAIDLVQMLESSLFGFAQVIDGLEQQNAI